MPATARALDTSDDFSRPVLEITGSPDLAEDDFALVSKSNRTGETEADKDVAGSLTASGAGTMADAAMPRAVAYKKKGELVRAVRNLMAAPSIQIVEQWHGVVEEIDGDNFYARVLTPDGPAELPEEEGLFPLSMVSEDDRELVGVGAFFTYTVARENRSGTRVNMSVLAFRRMPMWHLRQVADARTEGKRISNYLQQATELDRIHSRAASI